MLKVVRWTRLVFHGRTSTSTPDYISSGRPQWEEDELAFTRLLKTKKHLGGHKLVRLQTVNINMSYICLHIIAYCDYISANYVDGLHHATNHYWKSAYRHRLLKA